MKFLILFLFSLSAMANYIPESKFGESNDLTVYMKQKTCEKKEKESCIKIDANYNPSYSKRIDEEIDDHTKPVRSKTIVNECGEYCQSLFDNDYKDYECVDTDEKLILNLDTKQIYCSKFLRYEQKLSGRKIIAIDQAKKDVYDAKIEKKAIKAAKKKKGSIARAKCLDALNLISGYNLDSEATEEQIDMMQASFEPIHKALQNSRPTKALRLIKLVTDPAYDNLKADVIEILE